MGGQQSKSYTKSSNQKPHSKSHTGQPQKYSQVYHAIFQSPTLQTLKTYFSQSRRLAEGLFNLFVSMKNHSYQSFVQVISYLTRLDPVIRINTRLQQLSNETSLMDRFMMLIYQVETLATYKNIEVSKNDKLECLNELFALYCNSKVQNIVHVADLIPEIERKEMLYQFAEKFKNTLMYSQKMIIQFYERKLTSVNNNVKLFKTIPDSNLLGMEDWLTLSMKNMKICHHEPTLLYSLDKNGYSFHSLYRNLIGYQGPWILVLSHYETDIITKQLKLCIFGSYQNVNIEDVSSYQGNPEGFLFRISPQQKYWTASDGEGQTNYVYINTTQTQISKMPRGLGFGGKEKQEFKIWIDETMESNSYVINKQDPTYGSGSLAFPGTTKLKIRDLQIWGLGDETSLAQRQAYWQSREQEAYKRRKVNKKDLMAGGLTNILFENTFKHREQIVGEIDKRQDQF